MCHQLEYSILSIDSENLDKSLWTRETIKTRFHDLKDLRWHCIKNLDDSLMGIIAWLKNTSRKDSV